MPSGELATEPLAAKITNFEPVHVMAVQVTADGRVRDVHVIPSVDVRALPEDGPIAQKVEPPAISWDQLTVPSGDVRAVQVVPSEDDAAAVELSRRAAKTEPFQATCQTPVDGSVAGAHVTPSDDVAAAFELKETATNFEFP